MGFGIGLALPTTLPPLNIIAETWGQSSFRTQFPHLTFLQKLGASQVSAHTATSHHMRKLGASQVSAHTTTSHYCGNLGLVKFPHMFWQIATSWKALKKKLIMMAPLPSFLTLFLKLSLSALYPTYYVADSLRWSSRGGFQVALF